MNNPKRIIISGGGTGGHIFPAISIANALKDKQANIEILFVGANGKMEMEKVPAAGYRIVGLPIRGFHRKLSFHNVKVLFQIISSLFKARKIISEFKPDAAVGVGGYASGPLLYAATGKKVPCVIQEQNSYAGVTNKILAKKVKKICVAYDGMERFFPAEKIVFTGNPIRKDLNNNALKKQEAFSFFKIDKSKKVLLILGGSLGARTLNQSMLANIEMLQQQKDVYVLWQCGKIYFEDIKKQLADKKVDMRNIKLLDFISRMDLAFAAADVVVSRAGAETISELCAVAKPSILVPSPNVAEDHQTKNALALVEKNAALMILDSDAIVKLVPVALELLYNEMEKQNLSNNILNLAIPDAAERIANEILKLIK